MWKAKYECSTAMASEINTWHYTTIYYSHKSKLASLSNELGTRDKWYEAQHYQFSYKHLCPDADDMHKEIFRSVFCLWLHINKEYRNNEKMLWQKKAWNRNFHHARSNTSSSTRFALAPLVFHFFSSNTLLYREPSRYVYEYIVIKKFIFFKIQDSSIAYDHK